MWIRANPCGPSQAALESLWRSREAQDGLSSSQDQLQDGTTPWTLPGWSRMFSKSKQQLQVTFFSISPGVGGSILCHGLPCCSHSFQAKVGCGVCAVMGSVGPPGPVPAARPAQPARGPSGLLQLQGSCGQ